MLSIFMVIIYLFIFIIIAGVIVKNVMNIRHISEKFKNIYEAKGKEGLYKYVNENQSQKQNEKTQDNVTFNSSIELGNNPIKEKKGKRGSI